MSRSVYLIVYHSPLFPAHWALYIPNLPHPVLTTTSDSTSQVVEGAQVRKVGKIVNVVGSVAAGFAHEFKRNYDLEEDGRGYSLFLLDERVDGALVWDRAEEGETIDAQAQDPFEVLALSVPAPGPSLNSAADKGRRVQIRNCQTWLREAVERYVTAGIMHEVALERLATAPVN